MLNYEEFKEYVKDHIKDYLPLTYKDAEVRIEKIRKNNNQFWEGLQVIIPGQNVIPNIYLEQTFQAYKEGTAMEDILKGCASVITVNKASKFFDAKDMIYNWSFVKEHLMVQVVNAQRNQERLKEIPHVMKEDLALTYRIVLEDGEDGRASTQVDNRMLGHWGVTKEELHETAMENSKVIAPAILKCMGDMMMGILGAENMEGVDQNDFMKDTMFIISNEQLVDGASAIFYGDCLERLAEKMESDLYILPSSIHETIVISTEGAEVDELASIVQAVNSSEVNPEEQLSDHVYRYDAASREIKLADTTMERIREEMAVAENHGVYQAAKKEQGLDSSKKGKGR